MIDRGQAADVARRFLRDLSDEFGVELSLVEERARETADGWVFFWNSSSYLRTGAISDALVGNGPLRVDRADGSVTRLPVNFDVHELEERR